MGSSPLKELATNSKDQTTPQVKEYYLPLKTNNKDRTPLAKITQHVKKNMSQENPKKMAILISTGSYNPLHLMHVHMLEVAKKHLEKADYCVVGGYISPSHDFHVMLKLGDEGIKAKDRCNMIELALQDSDWIALSSWECEQDYFVDFGAVTKNIEEFIHQNFPENKIECFYCCGGDLVIRCRLHNTTSLKVIGVNRPGWTSPRYPNVEIKEKDEPNKIFYWAEDKSVGEHSSTEIRDRLKKGMSIDDITFPSVVKYLKTNLKYCQNDNKQ